MKYAFIYAELCGDPLWIVCRVLGVTQAGYHAWQGKAPSRRDTERDGLRADIQDDKQKDKYVYGPRG